MALTKEFRESVQVRLAGDPSYRRALLAEAVNELLAGERQSGTAMLRDYINATIGFDALANELGKSTKTLERMLDASGNPAAENLSGILKTLQSWDSVHVAVKKKWKHWD